MERGSQLSLHWVILGLLLAAPWISRFTQAEISIFSDDPSEDYFPPTRNFVRIRQKVSDPPMPHVRVNCYDADATGKQLLQKSETLEPGETFELFPNDDGVSFKCSFAWVRFGGAVGIQNFVVFSAPEKQEVLMLPFYCRLCLWIFDHQGFELYNNKTKSYVHVHDWIYERR